SNIFQYYFATKPDSAKYYLDQGVKYFTDVEYKKGAALMLLLEGDNEAARGRIELARQYKLKSLKISTEINDVKGISSVKNGLGTLEGRTGNYTKATKYFMEALKGFESIKDTSGIIATYLKLGVVNDYSNNLTKSLEYYNNAIELAEKQAFTPNLLYLYDNIGVIYFKTRNATKAIYYFNKALNMSNDNELARVKIQSLTNLGNAYSELGNEEKALVYFNGALKLCSLDNLPEEYARLLLNKANITYKKDPKSALVSLNESKKVAKQIGQKTLEWEVLWNIINIYKEQKDYKNAFLNSEKAMDLRDSIFSLEKEKEIADLQSNYELEKSNNKVQQLELSDKRNLRLRNIIILIACGLFFTLLSLFSFYLKSKRLNKELSDRGLELQKANTVKDRLFSIIGHDLRGPIANVPLMLELYEDKDTTLEEKRYIIDSIKENAGISLETLDKLLHWGKSQIKGITISQQDINVNEHLEGVIKLIKSISNNKHIAVKNKIKDDVNVYVDPDHFNFIFRNLLANAVKFTHNNGRIEIEANTKAQEDSVIFSVSDNGVGIDKDQQGHIFELINISTTGTANEKGDSIGLMLCKEFVLENGGKIWVESEKGEGTTIFFSLKIVHTKVAGIYNDAIELNIQDKS
ncbi:MAG TPA: tetratricopeptide repeat-containing sensor histidine kinase, partial [Saprospiraceae bacterium]|nr:tetratricopeptide repeat-containing sensor histidine kinase [Saprospiraceae bacterium]